MSRRLTWLTAALLLCGCGGGMDGPTRYPVSGTVTFDGKPVPKGFITLTPNHAKGNSGPGGGGPIKDGTYSIPEEKGVVGGQYLIKITGTDGVPYKESGEDIPDGKPLFAPYETEFEFPKEPGEKNFEIPKPAE